MHVCDTVLQGLERSDRSAELLALFHIADGEIKHAPSKSKTVTGDCHSEQARQRSSNRTGRIANEFRIVAGHRGTVEQIAAIVPGRQPAVRRIEFDEPPGDFIDARRDGKDGERAVAGPQHADSGGQRS